MLLPIDQDLSLHPPAGVSAGALFRLIDGDREYLQRWLPWLASLQSESDVRNWLYDEHRYRIGGQRFTAFIRYRDRLAGSIALTRIDRRHRRAELGYWLGRDYQGQGLMTRCGRAFVRHCFEERRLNRLEIYAYAGNDRGQAVAQRLGFRREGRLCEHSSLNGKYVDVYIFGLFYGEWKKKQKKL